MPLLYGLLTHKFRINDLMIVFFSKTNGMVKLNPLNHWHMTMFILGKISYITTRIILPIYFGVPIWRLIIHFILSELAMSYMLALVFQVNHVMPHAKWPRMDKETGYVNMDWAEMQVRTTIDYAHNNFWTTYFTGGLNYQVTHHLFPYVAQSHYMDIGKIIYQHCKEYQIEYVVLPSFWAALKGHIQHLNTMGTIHTDF